MKDFDVCIVGSGAGGGPVAWTLARAGYSVVVLEKGPWLKEGDFYKDEIGVARREAYYPNRYDEPQVIETGKPGDWDRRPTRDPGWNFWNGNMVGGATNLMSGFFHRLKPVDFRLRSEFGLVEGAHVADWPITYDDLEPYYARVEQVVGVSGRIVEHPNAEPRSTPSLPFEPILEHPLSGMIEDAARKAGYHPIPVPRAILSSQKGERHACAYSGWCAVYGCATGAKGSSRAALLDDAVATGHCEVRPHSQVHRLHSGPDGKVQWAEYTGQDGLRHRVDARIFVVACQAVETSRLLLNSPGEKHPDGLGNHNGRVGQDLLFSSAGSVFADLDHAALDADIVEQLRSPVPWINRAIQDAYVYEDEKLGRIKGGTIDFLKLHPNAIAAAQSKAWHKGAPLWGQALKDKLKWYFSGSTHLKVETFADWMPTPDSFVTLDRDTRDVWGQSVARVRIGRHPRNRHVTRHLVWMGRQVVKELGATNWRWRAYGNPSTNLLAGGCRFGANPDTSVLDADCRSHSAENLYVTDGSFMPTGGSVPYTFTIYANSFRVADKIVAAL